ncbi:hypothetical protein [Caulobacter sp. 17J65-9]|uniref:hypothetical protein n=1 Tax=Caulobacter sp. 17J65-9 TaxID=2709382 RepID=UPI0013CC07C1|nr:hypothetical protein [Caulobacter sp. 17J65-9]NEX91202.1 hypothetical protein [Caulobacter sp. 17J65-9]
MTEDRRKITDLSIDDRTARVLEAGMKAATSPAGMQAHATATSTFKGLSYAIWLLPVIAFLWASSGRSIAFGVFVALLACLPAAFFSFVWGKIAQGNEELRKNLKDAGIVS